VDRAVPHDLVLFGATSFVGRIVTRHLVDRLGAGGDTTWAIAGRDPAKLAEVAAETGAEVERIVADASSPDDMASLATGGRVVVSTVGPYARYGDGLVAAVAAAGGAYCDLTGEPQWMRRMIDAHQEAAVASGARIVHGCGFDSIPSDLGVHFVQREAERRFGAPCGDVRYGVHDARGGFSGGTIASGLNLLEEAAADAGLRDLLADPYALCPPDARDGVDQPEIRRPTYHEGLGSWQAPFVMAGTNTKVVHRSHALLGRPWGSGFTYGEAMLTGDGWRGRASATVLAGATAVGTSAVSVGPLRGLVRAVAPKPGEGPSSEKQEAGHFDVRLHGRTADDQSITARITGDRDPGYGSTAKMLAESALVLLDPPTSRVGFLTPATALGDAGIEALVAHAGLTFEVL
jgi:short subunit dehydrogenase-like uncharacterized protein